jgi:maltose alpha-D-glucosyltransferase/alpha-amylase
MPRCPRETARTILAKAAAEMIDLWYKNAVFYSVDVETFFDSNGDGVGDFPGLAKRLDHIEALGATCIWLLPFQPTPNRDNGYDITDYYGVDPRLGTLGDFVEFIQAARSRGLKVIVDLVINHTSIDHPWFQSARSDPDSPKRHWYLWADRKPADADEGLAFPGVQQSTWSYDEAARAFYHHRFHSHQADLNIANPEVRREIERIVGFWLELGVSGFRIDAVPFLLDHMAELPDGWDSPFDYFRELRRFLSWRKAEAILLGEANVTLDEARQYFAEGDGIHLLFNFVLNQQLFLALAREDAGPVARTLRKLPDIDVTSQWATFLRNHDELDLGRLSAHLRNAVFAALGPDPDMQIYGRGLRRRLAPMLEGDLRRVCLAFSLLVSLPGSPVIWSGDEIGMGEDLALPERASVRTPMQWDGSDNGGFSAAPAEKLVRPMVSDGKFRFSAVNVAADESRPGSLMHRIAAMIRLRRSSPEIGWGRLSVIPTGAPEVLGMLYIWEDRATLTLHNFSAREVTGRLRFPHGAAFSPSLAPGPADLDDGRFELEPFGYRWFCRGH